ncbi:MAG TPA: ClpXP protease specificity-enhancing factor SspB, partial [Acetobacteraceae bacterium]|nr:ClpXP protease specificity-enhancing factor SspB [Acetobacteraceae bacterium]
MSDETKQAPSLMPYETWTDDALREVVVRALEHVAKNGLPGEHHFYLTFRTDHPGAKLPGHLRARYP